MTMEPNLNTGDWKAGTEALAFCMICGAEYPPETRECPDCHVSLSVVRRCPSCRRIVSAQHKRCVYCRFSFTEELPHRPASHEFTTLDGEGAGSSAARRFRAAAVSISTFIVVFCLGMFFLHEIKKPAFTVSVIAKAHLLHSAELRHAPSTDSSNIGSIARGTTVDLTGFEANEQGRWMAVEWNANVGYLSASDLSAPRAVEADEGAGALKFYVDGMDSADSAAEAVKAVGEYAHDFPGNPHLDELRWALGERLRALSARGGTQGAALRSLANQEYEQLAAGNGKFAAKATDALHQAPSAGEKQFRTRSDSPNTDSIQIIGASGTQRSTQSGTHNVLVLTQAEVRVHPGNLSQLAAGAVVAGHVANAVKTNGIVAIPAGAPCQLTVVKTDPAQGRLSLALSSIEINHRAYAVQSPVVDIRSGRGEAAIRFRLNEPLVIER